jgi:uncharacterized membrane-anchored protein
VQLGGPLPLFFDAHAKWASKPLAALTTSWAISRRTVLTEQQRTDAISQLNWLKAGTYKLPASNSTIALPEGYLMVRGEDARRLLTLSAESDDAAEAVVMSPHFNDEIVFENTSEGYVAVDDWADVDPVKMLDTIRENTEKANTERQRQGVGEMHVVGWLQRPTLDRNTATVYWATAGVERCGRLAVAEIGHDCGQIRPRDDVKQLLLVDRKPGPDQTAARSPADDRRFGHRD